MNATETRIQTLVEEFSFFEDWSDKYAHIIEMGKSLPPMPESYKTEDHLIKGCQSRVWLHAEANNGRIHLYADSDAIIVKGIAGMLVRVYDQSTPDEILQASTDFMDAVGLQQHLSPTRANGLASMVKQIKLYALALQLNNADSKH